MKFAATLHLLLLILLMFSGSAIAQEKKSGKESSKHNTILWKISGGDCKQPSFLLGTFHLSEAEWLLEYPEFKKVIDSTNFILTEAFTTQMSDTSSMQVSKLKALPLLTKEQFHTLDSFFVARVGEGIKGNDEAENMTVAEMGSAILVTLVSGTKGANGVTKYMDLDLFTMYQQLGRGGDRLDRIKPTEFNSDNVEHAKQHLARSLSYIKNSDKPDWNIYQMKEVDKIVADYKRMEIDYKLNEPGKFGTTNDYDFSPMEVRNETWMSKITSKIAQTPCLIAVGLDHLRYQSSLINLLRERGYIVEPVLFGRIMR